MDIHRFDKNGFYVKSHKARLDPEETKKQGKNIYLKPANAHFGSLPIPGENEIIRLISGETSIAKNYKGQHYYQQDGVKIKIYDFGVDIPDGCIQVDPPTIYHDTHNGIEWIENIEAKVADEEEELRLADIEAEQDSGGLKSITVEKAHQKIDQIFEGATTVAQVKAASILALKKMLPYILK